MDSEQGADDATTDLASQDDNLHAPTTSPDAADELAFLASPDISNAIEALNKSRLEFERDASAREKQELSDFHADLQKHLDTVRTSRNHADHATKQRTWTTRLQSSYDRFSKTAFHFARHLDAVAVVAPSYVQAAWGAVHLLLMVQINYTGLRDCMEQQLDRIMKEMRYLPAMTSYTSNAIAKEALSDVYKAYLKFLDEAIKASTATRMKKLCKGAVHHAQQISNVAMMETHVDTNNKLTLILTILEKGKRLGHFECIRPDDSHNSAASIAGHLFERSETLSVKSQSRRSTSHGPARDMGLEDPADDDSPMEGTLSILDELDDLWHNVAGKYSSSPKTEHISTAQDHRYDLPAVHDDARAIASFLEANGSGVLHIEGQGSKQQLIWNIAIVDCIISDIVKSHASTATLRFHASGTVRSLANLTPTAVLQVFILQLLRQYKKTLVGKDLPSRQDLERASHNFSLSAELLRRCIAKCSVRNIIMYIDRVDQLCFQSTESQQPVDGGSLQDFVNFIEDLSTCPDLVIKAILTGDTISGTEGNADPDPDPQIDLPEKMSLQRILTDSTRQQARQPSESYGQTLRRYLDFTCSQARSLGFADLWMIYQPNTVVYTLDQGDWRALVVIDLASTNGPAREWRH